MKKTGKSGIWYEKYRPVNFDDIIVLPAFRNYLTKIKEDGEVGNLIFNGHPGTGKTSIARAIVKELNASCLYVNGALDTSINDVRYNVQSFATTKSLMETTTQKIVILDEFDRLSPEAMDSLKAMIEETHRNCRYIFITNNISKIISPLLSRAEQFTFGTETGEERKGLIVQFFTRARFILDTENVEYDKKALAGVVQETFPDFRRTVDKLQNYFKQYGKIDEGILATLDDAITKDLITEMKSMNFNKVQMLARGIDPAQFYRYFYNEMREHVVMEQVPDLIVLMSEYNYRDGMVLDREINLVACLAELMKAVQWK